MVMLDELPSATCYDCSHTASVSSFLPIFTVNGDMLECPDCGSVNVVLAGDASEGDERVAD